MKKRYKISQLTPTLKKKICLWDRYQGKSVGGYEKFLTYLHSEGVKKYFDAVELDAMLSVLDGEAREQKTFVLEENGEVKSFVATRIDYEDLSNPSLYIQSIATHPKEQGKGYATTLVKGILKKPQKYFGLKPKLVYGLVKNTNTESQHFFQKLGDAKKEPHDEDYDVISVELSYDKFGNLQKER